MGGREKQRGMNTRFWITEPTYISFMNFPLNGTGTRIPASREVETHGYVCLSLSPHLLILHRLSFHPLPLPESSVL